MNSLVTGLCMCSRNSGSVIKTCDDSVPIVATVIVRMPGHLVGTGIEDPCNKDAVQAA